MNKSGVSGSGDGVDLEVGPDELGMTVVEPLSRKVLDAGIQALNNRPPEFSDQDQVLAIYKAMREAMGLQWMIVDVEQLAHIIGVVNKRVSANDEPLATGIINQLTWIDDDN